MSLYPSKSAVIPEYGREFPAGYVPRPLDSIEAAKARAIASLDAGDSPPVALGKALKGSDEVVRVGSLIYDLLAEAEALRRVPLDEESKYAAAVAAKAQLLDAPTWVARQKTVAPLVKPVVESLEK